MARAAAGLALLAVAWGCGDPDGVRHASHAPAPMPAPAGRGPLVDGAPRSPRIASYEIVATLDVAGRQVRGRQVLRWRHDGVLPVDALPFHLYLNAFANESTRFMREARGAFRTARAEVDADAWGWIDVTSIRIGEVELRPAARFGEDETVLVVPLASAAHPGETLEVTLEFTARLPEVFARTGVAGEHVVLGQWFPKIGVLERVDAVAGAPPGQAWRCEPFHANAEFYADFGVYDVTLTLPDTHVVAATGVLTAAVAGPGALRTLTFRAEDVHDFALVADPHLEVLSGAALGGDVDVHVYHRRPQRAFARRHLEAAIRTIDLYSAWFLPYPWTAMTVVDPPPEAQAGAGGMEYPTLVLTGGDTVASVEGAMYPEFVTIHEVGHAWFQGILASDEGRQAWLDEGVNQYLNGLVLDAWKGPDRSALDLVGVRVGVFPLVALAADGARAPLAIDSLPPAFPTFDAYADATYTLAAQALKSLEAIHGRDRFLAALGVYARAHAFRHPRGTDLFQVLGEELGAEARAQAEAAFGRAGVPDLRVLSITNRPAVAEPRGVFGVAEARRTVTGEPVDGLWETAALLATTGPYRLPVWVELGFEDGVWLRRWWDGRDAVHAIETRHPARLITVRIDPDRQVLLEPTPLDNGWRLERRSAPAARAGARAGFWAQTVFQLVGL